MLCMCAVVQWGEMLLGREGGLEGREARLCGGHERRDEEKEERGEKTERREREERREGREGRKGWETLEGRVSVARGHVL